MSERIEDRVRGGSLSPQKLQRLARLGVTAAREALGADAPEEVTELGRWASWLDDRRDLANRAALAAAELMRPILEQDRATQLLGSLSVVAKHLTGRSIPEQLDPAFKEVLALVEGRGADAPRTAASCAVEVVYAATGVCVWGAHTDRPATARQAVVNAARAVAFDAGRTAPNPADEQRVREQVCAELIPWILGESDPLVERLRKYPPPPPPLADLSSWQKPLDPDALTFAEFYALSPEVRAGIDEVFKTLTNGDRTILWLRSGLDPETGEPNGTDGSWETVGAATQLTPETVITLERKVIRKLQHPTRFEALRPVVEAARGARPDQPLKVQFPNGQEFMLPLRPPLRVMLGEEGLKTPLNDLVLSTFTRLALESLKLRTVGELVKKTEEELLAHWKFREEHLVEVKELLAKNDLALSPPPERLAAMEISEAVAAEHVSNLNLSVRCRNKLESLGIETVGQLIQHSPADLAKVRNLGRVSQKELERELKKRGLALRASP